MHYETKLALFEAQLAEVQAELWEVQLKEFPDSIKLSIGETLDLTYKDPSYLKEEMQMWTRDWGRMYNTKPEELNAYMVIKSQIVTSHRLALARNCIIAMRHPQGFFYRCGKQEDGTYKWRGYRYGVKPEEYMSSFIL